jgi:GNAT superfamily N-acetyltransferase
MTYLKNYIAYDKTLDGRTIAIRAIKPNDKWCLQELFAHLGSLSRYYRFLTPKNVLTETELSYFTELDFIKHVGLIATIVENGVRMIAGIGRYILTPTAPESPGIVSAEFALTVEDQYHGLGIGTVLIKHLIQIARANGVSQFTALALQENHQMLELAEHLGVPIKEHNCNGVVEITMDISRAADNADCKTAKIRRSSSTCKTSEPATSI